MHTFLSKSGLVMLILLAAATARAAVPAGERAALIALYDATNGAGWSDQSNWRNAGDTDFNVAGTECQWFGVSCDSGETTVIGLSMASNNLSGSMPIQLGDLTNLQSLDLRGNSLTGSIPAVLGSLTSLQSIFLDGNQLSGSLPPELGSLSHLQWLKLGTNQLDGSIPATLGGLSSLTYLDLSSNHLEGTIPPALGRLSNLLQLVLMSNQLTGSIPPELGNLGSLVGLLLYNNQLSGAIPPQLGGLTNLQTFDLDSNQLTGSLPTELSALSNLKIFRVSYNHLEGPIPTWIGDLSGLTSLWLGGNRFDGSIPSNLSNLVGLQDLTLDSNRLTGRVPSSLAGLSNLQNQWSLQLRRNGLWSDDATLDVFLGQYSSGWGDWKATQTIAPTAPTVTAMGDTTIWLSWSPILYTGDEGGYEVLWRESPAGAWHSAGWTASKSGTTFPVTGLAPGTTYDVGVRSFTEPNVYNQNQVVSELSSTYVATTGAVGCAAPVITSSGGIPASLGLTGSYSTYQWSTGETTAAIDVSPAAPTWYWVTVSWPGSCEETAAILVDPVKIFADGFESGGTGEWSAAVGLAP